MNAPGLYARFLRMHLRAAAQYPLSFALQTLSQLVMLGGELAAVLLIFDRFASFGRWTGAEILFFFGMMSVTFYLTEFFARGITNFSPLVRTGAMDALLLRPRGVLLQVLCHELDVRRVGAVGIGVAALILGARGAGVVWSVGKALLLCWAVAGGMLLVIALFLVEATCCFFSVRSIEMVNVLTYGGRSACQYPVDIYPRPLRALFLVVAPFALTTHVPAAYILGKPLFGWGAGAAALAPLAGAAAFLALLCAWRAGLRHYRSTGS